MIQQHVQRDVTHSFSQALKCFSHLCTNEHTLPTSTRASMMKKDRKKEKKIKNRGGLKRSGPAGSWMPEAGCQSPSGPGLGATVRPPSLQMAPCPLALYCCCDICQNNQVAFVWALHSALEAPTNCLRLKITVVSWYYLINPKSTDIADFFGYEE